MFGLRTTLTCEFWCVVLPVVVILVLDLGGFYQVYVKYDGWKKKPPKHLIL